MYACIFVCMYVCLLSQSEGWEIAASKGGHEEVSAGNVNVGRRAATRISRKSFGTRCCRQTRRWPCSRSPSERPTSRQLFRFANECPRPSSTWPRCTSVCLSVCMYVCMHVHILIHECMTAHLPSPWKGRELVYETHPYFRLESKP